MTDLYVFFKPSISTQASFSMNAKTVLMFPVSLDTNKSVFVSDQQEYFFVYKVNHLIYECAFRLVNS